MFFFPGEFGSCHDYFDPEVFYDACVYDLCALLPDEEAICSSFACFADACRAAGGMPGPWRDVITECGKFTDDTCVACLFNISLELMENGTELKQILQCL